MSDDTKSIDKQEILEGIKHLVDKGELNFYDCESIASTAKKSWLKNKHGDKSQERLYADFQIGAKSFEKIINTDLNTNQALVEAAEELGRDEDYLKKVKHKNFLHSNKIIDRYQHTPLVQAIRDHDILDISELSTASRLYLFINTAYIYKQYLEDQRIINERLEQLENFTSEQEQLNDSLRASLYSMKMDIKALQEATAIKGASPKDKAIALDNMGISASIIADEVGMSVRTVYRWLNENKQLEEK